MKKTSLLFLFAITLMSFADHAVVIPKDAFVLVVDAGHGGEDLGFTSADGIHEKQLTLAIAQHIQQACKEKGIQVMLTRSEDKALKLDERVSLSAAVESGLFISIHINADRHDYSKSGIECMITEQHADYIKSKQFSQVLTTELKTLQGIAVHETKNSSIYILTNNSIPTVILELGYLSNPSDFQFISNEQNQKNIADKIVSSVLKYQL